MSALANCSGRSFVAPARSDSACFQGLKRLGWFAITVPLVSGVVSFLLSLLPILDHLSWWMLFRRCVSIVAASALVVLARRDPQHCSPRALGLGEFRKGRGPAVFGVAVAFGIVLLILGGYLASGVCRISIHPDTARVVRVVLTFLPIAVLVSVLEELVFRGFVLQQLLSCSRVAALVLSSLAYALVHMRTRWLWPDTALEIGGLFLLGVVLSLSYFRTQQLYLAIGLHAGFAYWGRATKLLIEFTVPSLQWLTGTGRLINGLVAWLALVMLGLAIWRSPAQRTTLKT